MMINPVIASSSSGGAEYAQNGLVIFEENFSYGTYNNRRMVMDDVGTNMSLEGTTIEVLARIDGITSGTYLTLFGAGSFVFGGSNSANAKGAGADFGIDVWWTSENHFIPVDGLVFGNWHTFTLVSDTESMRLYIDGVPSGTLNAYNYSQSITNYGVLRATTGTASSYRANGYWASARVYNRPLSAAEIAQNRAVDLQRYNV